MHKVELSEPKILKQPENGGTSAVGSILKGLGMKSDPKYPTPEEFIRASQGEDGAEQPQNYVSAAALGLGGPSSSATMNMNLLQMMSASGGIGMGGLGGQTGLGQGMMPMGMGLPAPPPPANPSRQMFRSI